MSRNQEEVIVPHGEWVELTNADTQQVTFQVIEGRVEIRIGGTSPPHINARGWRYSIREGERNISLSDISVEGGSRLWALGMRHPDSVVVIDHA